MKNNIINIDYCIFLIKLLVEKCKKKLYNANNKIKEIKNYEVRTK